MKWKAVLLRGIEKIPRIKLVNYCVVIVDFVLRIIFPIYRYNFNQERLIILTIGSRRIIFTFLPYVAIIILL